MAGPIRFKVKVRISRAYQFDVLSKFVVLRLRQRSSQLRISDALAFDNPAKALALGVIEQQHTIVRDIIGAFEISA